MEKNVTEFVEYKGKRILCLRYLTLTKEEFLAQLEEVKALVASQAPNSLLIVTVFGGLRFDTEIAAAVKDYIAHNKPYVRASAVVGISGLRRSLYNAVVYLTRRQIKVCQTEEEALEYLASVG